MVVFLLLRSRSQRVNCLFPKPARVVALVFKKRSPIVLIIYISSDLELLNWPGNQSSLGQLGWRGEWGDSIRYFPQWSWLSVLIPLASSWVSSAGFEQIYWFHSSGMSNLFLSGLLIGFLRWRGNQGEEERPLKRKKKTLEWSKSTFRKGRKGPRIDNIRMEA